MKKKYLSPELEILLLETTDIITASGVQEGYPGADESSSGNDLPWDNWG